jgi:hypothetical protein
VSIQGLILVPDPYFNEPGYAESHKTARGQAESRKYSLNIRRYTLEHAMDAFLQQAIAGGATNGTLRDYPEFTSIIVHHFLQRATVIEKQLNDWIRDDATIANLANRVRSNLQTLVRMHASLADLATAAAPPFAAAAAVSSKKPPPETIDLS